MLTKFIVILGDNQIKYKPFIKRVWWKRQLLEQFQSLYPCGSFSDHFKIKKYYEPFLWWGAVFFDLRNKFWLNFKAYLYDINSELINTYNVIKSNPKKLIKQLKSYKYDKEFFMEIRSWDQDPDFLKKRSSIERASRFIYLNRTCFNGMYRVNSAWFFNVPFWKYTNPKICDEEWILNSSEALQNTEIECKSFYEIEKIVEKWDFVYFDPPYDTLTTTANFTDYIKWWFWWDDQVRLKKTFDIVDKKGWYWMLSNHNTDRIRELYKDYNQKIVSATRMINSNAKKRWAIEEIVVLNYELKNDKMR